VGVTQRGRNDAAPGSAEKTPRPAATRSGREQRRSKGVVPRVATPRSIPERKRNANQFLMVRICITRKSFLTILWDTLLMKVGEVPMATTKHRITITLDDEEYDRLTRIAKKFGKSLSSVASYAIKGLTKEVGTKGFRVFTQWTVEQPKEAGPATSPQMIDK
jgi:hypothetical protein